MDGPNRSPKAWNTQNMGCCHLATHLSQFNSLKRVFSRTVPLFWMFSYGNMPFFTQIPNFDPLTSNSTPKLIHLITNIKRHQQQTSDYNTNSCQYHHLAHFLIFSFFIQTSKQPSQFKFSEHTNINKH